LHPGHGGRGTDGDSRRQRACVEIPTTPGPERVAQIPELEARGRQRVQLFWQHLEEHLDGREFLVGNAITMADIDAFVVVDFAGWIKERVPENRPRVQAWYQLITTLLSVSWGRWPGVVGFATRIRAAAGAITPRVPTASPYSGEASDRTRCPWPYATGNTAARYALSALVAGRAKPRNPVIGCR
jgi:Glutathione S-transferase, C-terminal domain